MNNIIQVTYEVGSTSWRHHKLLAKLSSYDVLGFDVETQCVYTKEERKEAEKLLEASVLPPTLRKRYSLISRSSGLSHPSLVRTTHFIFGISKSESVVLVTATAKEEMAIWKWVAKQDTHFLVWNALFDLKIMHHRTGKFPKKYTDGMLKAKCLINNVDNYKAKVGLKDIMGSYYKPAWALYDNYDPDSLLDPEFLAYCSIDGASTVYAHTLIQEASTT